MLYLIRFLLESFVPSISISFSCECYINMQMQQTNNLNPEIFELGKHWVIRISLLILHSTLFVLTTKSVSNEPTNDKSSGQTIAYQGSTITRNKDNFAYYHTAKAQDPLSCMKSCMALKLYNTLNLTLSIPILREFLIVKPIFNDTKHFLLHWATLIHNLYIMINAAKFQFIVLLLQRCFVWSKSDHTHQAITNDR